MNEDALGHVGNTRIPIPSATFNAYSLQSALAALHTNQTRETSVRASAVQLEPTGSSQTKINAMGIVALLVFESGRRTQILPTIR